MRSISNVCSTKNVKAPLQPMRCEITAARGENLGGGEVESAQLSGWLGFPYSAGGQKSFANPVEYAKLTSDFHLVCLSFLIKRDAGAVKLCREFSTLPIAVLR